MALSVNNETKSPKFYKQIAFIPSNKETTNKVLMEMSNNEYDSICVLRDYKTNEILFLCNYNIWNKIMIGDIRIEF